MAKPTLEQRVAELERRVAELSAKVIPERNEGGMTGPDLIDYMQQHGEELAPIFDEAMKLRQKDREKAYRKFDREEARKAARRQTSAARQRAKT